MAEPRDSFLAAVTAYLANGGRLQLLTAPSDCCPGRIADGPAGCTCWSPIYDLPRTGVDWDIARALAAGDTDPEVREGMYDDCAYRPHSPEKTGQNIHTHDAPDLERRAASGERFYCHDGLRSPTGWQHPAGIHIPADPGRDGDFQPPVVFGVPFRADGQPALVCAGWAARRRALTAKETPDG